MYKTMKECECNSGIKSHSELGLLYTFQLYLPPGELIPDLRISFTFRADRVGHNGICERELVVTIVEYAELIKTNQLQRSPQCKVALISRSKGSSRICIADTRR